MATFMDFMFTISIHAPAKGATSNPLYFAKKEVNFNPRSREGSDDIYVVTNGFDEKFQSTLPRRERQFAPTQKNL